MNRYVIGILATLAIASASPIGSAMAQTFMSHKADPTWPTSDCLPSDLYEVEFVAGATDVHVTPFSMTAPFPRAELAMSGDGRYLYAIENVRHPGGSWCNTSCGGVSNDLDPTNVDEDCTPSAHVGQVSRLDLQTGSSWEELGNLGLRNISGAVIVRDTLYVTSKHYGHRLYAIDLSAVIAGTWSSDINPGGAIRIEDTAGVTVGVQGGDLVAYRDGDLLLWSNSPGQQGVWRLDMSSMTATEVTASLLADGSAHNVTGLSVRTDGSLAAVRKDGGATQDFLTLAPDVLAPHDWNVQETHEALLSGVSSFDNEGGDLASRPVIDYCDFSDWTVESSELDYLSIGYQHDHRGLWSPYPTSAAGPTECTGGSPCDPGSRELTCAVWQQQRDIVNPTSPSTDSMSGDPNRLKFSADPTWLVSPDEDEDFIDVRITGRFAIDDAESAAFDRRGFVGLVFGYQKSDTTCLPTAGTPPAEHCYLDFILWDTTRRNRPHKDMYHALTYYRDAVDVTRGVLSTPISDSSAPAFGKPRGPVNDPTGSYRVSDVWMSEIVSGHGYLHWKYGTDYEFTIDYTKTRIRVVVDEVGGSNMLDETVDISSICHLDSSGPVGCAPGQLAYPQDTFKPGRIGLYANQQSYATFYDLTVAPIQ